VSAVRRKAMKQISLGMLTAVSCILAVTSCGCTRTPYAYDATVWGSVSHKQDLLVLSGQANRRGGILGSLLGEPVSIVVLPVPSPSVTVGALRISSQKQQKCLPIRKWSAGGKTVFAICRPDAADRVAFLRLETESEVLTQPMLQELINRLSSERLESSE
jgi:hypothetical protein